MPDMDLIAQGLLFPEGPVATSSGTVIVAEIYSGQLTVVDATSGDLDRFAVCGGGPNGVAVGPNGLLYVCNNGGFEWHRMDGLIAPGRQPEDYSGGRIQTVEPASGAVRDLYTTAGAYPLRGPNDLVFDDAGGFWFTDLGKTRRRDSDLGGLYYATADGTSISEVVYPLTQPNGVGLSPDGKRIYVAETGPGRVWAWYVESPGKLVRSGNGPSGAELLWGFDGYQMLDSLAVDSEGNVCVATLISGAISVISPEAKLVEQIRPPEHDPLVTNICFGGPDLRTAYITSSGRGCLYSTRWPVPGLKLAYNL
jgi:gluconolactonase